MSPPSAPATVIKALAASLEAASLASLSERASNELGGASAAEMARLYVDGAWKTDAAVLDSMVVVASRPTTSSSAGSPSKRSPSAGSRT